MCRHRCGESIQITISLALTVIRVAWPPSRERCTQFFRHCILTLWQVREVEWKSGQQGRWIACAIKLLRMKYRVCVCVFHCCKLWPRHRVGAELVWLVDDICAHLSACERKIFIAYKSHHSYTFCMNNFFKFDDFKSLERIHTFYCMYSEYIVCVYVLCYAACIWYAVFCVPATTAHPIYHIIFPRTTAFS